jgi:PPM family protein phosphatase
MKLTAWSISDIGLKRKSNQDCIGQFADLRLFIVADGMGGHADGEVASRMAVDVIHSFFNGTGTMSAAASDEDCLKRAVELANGRIHERGLHSAGQAQGRSLGTTVVVLKLALDVRRAAWVHVGDSRLYRVRDGTLALLTADHTLFGQEYWNTRTIPTDLPHSNRLVQALGINENVDVATASDALLAGDLFLLCSDGVSGQLDATAIEQHLTATDDLQQSGEALIRLSLEAGGKDNASAVLVRVIED